MIENMQYTDTTMYNEKSVLQVLISKNAIYIP